jgi:hypothetical protein
MPTIYIPTALRPYADNQAQLAVEAPLCAKPSKN